jgi:hypothetical protein
LNAAQAVEVVNSASATEAARWQRKLDDVREVALVQMRKERSTSKR